MQSNNRTPSRPSLTNVGSNGNGNSNGGGGGGSVSSGGLILESKVVVLGSQGAGKTSVAVRYVQGRYAVDTGPTIGASFMTKKMSIQNVRVKLQIWDTAGQERFRSMAPMYYRGASAALLVYDITNRTTFDDVKNWVNELNKNIPNDIVLCLLGNKADLSAIRQVDPTSAEEYALSIGASFFETSALADQGIQEAFLSVAQMLIARATKDEHSRDSTKVLSSTRNDIPRSSGCCTG